jgi:DNA-binding transcriptional regulator YhcF (GntR family)
VYIFVQVQQVNSSSISRIFKQVAEQVAKQVAKQVLEQV